MLYSRGNRRDYDYWAALGNTGWDFRSVLPYFKKAEDYRGDLSHDGGVFHGRGGPLVVTPPHTVSPISRAFLAAGQELGYQVVDSNTHQQIGFSPLDLTIKDGVRCSTAECYLRPAAARPNLHILHSATAHQIVFDDYRRAVGVKFEHQGKVVVMKALKEVLVCAGSLASPKLLMLSGVGPQKHLQYHGVPVVADVAGVGRNLQDHLNLYGLTWTVTPGTLPSLNLEDVVNYLNEKKGKLAMPLGDHSSAWVNLGGRHGDPGWPDIQYLFSSVTLAADRGFVSPATFGFDPRKFNKYFGPILGQDGFTLYLNLLRPRSVGKVTLRSRDPTHNLVIDPNYLSHPEDVATMIKGIRFALAIGNTSALTTYFKAKFHEKPLPGCEGERYGSDSYWVCYLRHMASTYLHPVGTCRMAPYHDPSGVVDPRLRVRGVSGLRVVDSSIMPTIVSGNPNAAVIMIAEKAADILKEDWQGL